VAGDSSSSGGEEGATGGRELEEAIHVALTSNGSPYLNWQARIMYYTFLKVWPPRSPSPCSTAPSTEQHALLCALASAVLSSSWALVFFFFFFAV